DLIILDALAFDQPKTKDMVKVLGNLKIETKAAVVTAEKTDNVKESARNIPGIKPLIADGINVYDLLNHTKLILTKDAVAKIEEVWG
ncbi:MAG: 50S ribosomal protein L4, partial [Clostridia bacterium]|nr:50S ribosomal protein L4 [Clostridia bacterium]